MAPGTAVLRNVIRPSYTPGDRIPQRLWFPFWHDPSALTVPGAGVPGAKQKSCERKSCVSSENSRSWSKTGLRGAWSCGEQGSLCSFLGVLAFWVSLSEQLKGYSRPGR